MLFFDFKITFSCAADGALPGIGNIFKSRSGGDAVVGIAFSRIIDIAANRTYVFFHWFLLSFEMLNNRVIIMMTSTVMV